jgi:holo-[acyl-carrier protein] synthase
VVIGIGVDVVDVERFAKALERTPALKTRLFGSLDVADIGSGRAEVLSLAARFAAKEATVKALGGNIPGFSWHDVQVRRQLGQAPTLSVTGGANARAAEKGITAWHLSMSHDGPVAIAFVVASSGDSRV